MLIVVTIVSVRNFVLSAKIYGSFSVAPLVFLVPGTLQWKKRRSAFKFQLRKRLIRLDSLQTQEYYMHVCAPSL